MELRSFLSILFFGVVSSLLAEKETQSQCQVDSIVFRPQIAEGESMYHFSFNNLPGVIYRGGKQIPVLTHTIIYSYDGTNQTAILSKDKVLELKVKPGTYSFQFYLNDGYEEIYTTLIEAKSHCKTFVTCSFQQSAHRVICQKPVIYLYPEKETDVHVEVLPKGSFTFTYPLYDQGWDVTAGPDGDLQHNGNNYNYLFWESDQEWNPNSDLFKSGAWVRSEEVIYFLEKQLSEFGLNSKEKADFITYWGPQLQRNELNFVHFMVNDEANEFAELTIQPEPDHIYRIYMVSFAAEGMFPIEDQEFTKIDRTGFTVLEWGGMILDTHLNENTTEL